jgi:hypothetical protein
LVGFIGFLEDVFPAGRHVEFARGGIDGQRDLFARRVARGGDGFEHDFDGFFVRFQIRREAAFIAHRGGIAALFQNGLQIVEDFDAHAQGFAEARSADGHGHEFLEVDGIIGMRAAVQNVHHGHGQDVGVALGGKAREILVEREALGCGGGARGGHGDG